jgi:hypothetical protein
MNCSIVGDDLKMRQEREHIKDIESIFCRITSIYDDILFAEEEVTIS